MKLRIAKKICKAIGTPRDVRYTGWQKLQAVNRTERTKTAKQAELFWNRLMVGLGEKGRKELVKSMREQMP